MLQTKIHIPQSSKNIVHRRKLDDILNEGLKRKLILISASAGYGKTSAIADWINRNKICTAWYSLDENDNDLVVFLSYIIKGLQSIDESIGTQIQRSINSSSGLSSETAVELLTADLLKLENDILLVFDDFHYIVDKEIIVFINYFLEYLPLKIHLVLITRSDPSLKISKLRSRQQMVELRSAELSFSADDIVEFFRKNYNVSLPGTDANDLQVKTEGWISGIHLAGISIQSDEKISSFIKDLKGSNRYIMDYLIDEALSTLDKSVKEFLLKTSVLKRMCPELCDYMLDSDNSDKLLQKLEALNMFIVPLDNDRKWYRYHHLFSDLLKKRLQSSSSYKQDELHIRASEWLTDNHLLEDAIVHLLAAKEFKNATELIAREMKKIWDDGNHFRFKPWLKVLPETIVNEITQLIIIKAELEMVSWKIESAKLLLKKAEDLLNDIDNKKNNPLITLSDNEITKFKGRILVNYSLIATFDNNSDEILKYADEALELLSEDQIMLRNLAMLNQGDAYFYIGRLDDAYHVQSELIKSNQINQNPFLYLICCSYLATTLRHQGKPGEVLELCDNAYAYGIDNGLKYATSMGWLQIQKGEVLAEFNDLDEAEKIITQGIETARRSKIVSGLLKGYLLLIRVFFSAKKYIEIDKVLEKIRKESSGHGNTNYNKNQIEVWRVRIYISQNQLNELEVWLKAYEEQGSIEFNYINENKHIAASRAYIALGRLGEAEYILQKLMPEVQKYNRINSLIELFIIKSHLEHQRGEIETAKENLYKAYSLAEPGGYIRTFIDEGPLIEDITLKIKKESLQNPSKSKFPVSASYLDKIIRTLDLEKKKKEQPDDYLSSREIEILQLISERLSNKEICETLYISLSTVKTHISNILLKLGAKNRIEASEIAREKRLI